MKALFDDAKRLVPRATAGLPASERLALNLRYRLAMRQDVMTTVQMLARYLRAHPHVCDTADGIAHWWLLDLAPPPVVQEALDWMIGRGVLETLPAADGRTRLRRVADPAIDAHLEALAEGLDEPPARSLH